MKNQSESRRNSGRKLQVPVLAEEEQLIKEQAANAGLSVASYLRNLGLGYQPRTILDLKKIDELAQISANLGRLGGLLKLWLTQKETLQGFNEVNMRKILPVVIEEILENQASMRALMQFVLKASG